MVIVHIAGSERSDTLIIECVGGSGAGLDDVALVKLEFHFAGHILLGGFDKGLDRLADRGEMSTVGRGIWQEN